MTDPIEVPTYPAIAELIGPERWARGTARINNNRIELTSWQSYDPRTPHTGWALLFGLANIRTAGDALAFARAYGLLFTTQTRRAEEFSLWLAYGAELRGALTLHAHAQAMANSDADQNEAIAQKLKASIKPFRPRLTSEGRNNLDQHTLEQQASILIAQIMNQYLPCSRVVATALLEQEDKHGCWSIGTGAPPTILWRPEITNLVEYAHFMLALAVMNRLPVRACQGCPRVFVPDPPDKLYHDETCSDAARQRRHRAQTKTA